jgi:hypothetical protein
MHTSLLQTGLWVLWLGVLLSPAAVGPCSGSFKFVRRKELFGYLGGTEAHARQGGMLNAVVSMRY